MIEKYNDINIYYQKQSQFTKDVINWSLFFSVISILTVEIGNVYNSILKVICLVVVMILLVFITHSYNINPNPTIKIVRINTIIILFVYILQLVPLKSFETLKSLFIFNINKSVVEQGTIYFFISYYILSKSKTKNITKEYITMLIIIITVNILSNMNLENSFGIMLLYIIISEIIVIITIKNSFKYRLIIDKNINVFKVNIIACFICINIRQISKIFHWDILYIFLSNINTAVFIAALSAIINNISKGMYNFIFKDIHKINENLDDINNEIIIRNEELERSEKEIEYKQNRYRKLLNLLPNAIVIVSTENNRIIYCNSEFKKLIGVEDIRKILNKRIDNIISIDFECKNIEIETVINKRETYFGNNILNNKNKLEIRLSNYSKCKKEITMTFEDITEKMKIESIKNELERKRIKDDIKKNFLSNISHDFKIPVNVISSATQLENLLIENNDIEGVKKYNSISKQNCLLLIKLTNNIIDISKISSEYVKPVLTRGNIVEFIEELVISLVEYAKLSKINIIFDTYEEELYMKYDKELMERIILNLVSNAIKFTPEYGSINILINSNYKDIFISIEDTGAGMDEKFAKEAFNKYSMNLKSVYENIQGTGVGLYVVYNLVSLQKGEIWINSKIGEGTKFTMKFCKE